MPPYLARSLEPTLLQTAREFPSIVLTGPRIGFVPQSLPRVPLGPGVTQVLVNSRKGSPLVTSHMRVWIVQPVGGVLCFSISIPDRERAEELTRPFLDLILSASPASE